MEKVAADSPHPATSDEPPDDLRRVRAGLAELDPDKRTLLHRHYLEGQSVREIASHLGIPAGTVKSRLFNARNELRRRLEED
jgi:RNA polymerase sigma-70 factor (ECF subfamily)